MRTKLPQAVKERWDKVTKKEIYELAFLQCKSDNNIARMYGVTKSMVTYKRVVKFGMKFQLDSDAMRRSTRDLALAEIRNARGIPEKVKKEVAEITKKYYVDLPVEEWER